MATSTIKAPTLAGRYVKTVTLTMPTSIGSSSYTPGGNNIIILGARVLHTNNSWYQIPVGAFASGSSVAEANVVAVNNSIRCIISTSGGLTNFSGANCEVVYSYT